ncbi:NAD(P)/FAD-dependent oxidoreductase [Kordiimonas sp. SCSIO 12610]|uniref:NAD(P)/FAD-dependent oxidoreductase n=1 Tax=Kordiimonas sp. SCSIO 12610 TaxID=2829597 RepID=UPI00210C2909|nr:FAD-dependent oxidoreductase [Kordiimonas sp. SCSIO 12610]UTW54784.1 FAD-dependent oxidoreductase [Kordiimonas sp. SCSIO 12610]
MSDPSNSEKIVIIGAGQAAIHLAHALRAKKFDGEITIVGEEAYAPYQRPPLSKAFLKDELPEARLYLKPDTYYENKQISLHTNTRVKSIDRAEQRIHLSDNSTIPYDRLIIATGSRPRLLPELTGLKNVAVMRDMNDAKSLKAKLPDIQDILLIGGGYIGLEAAAVANELGKTVTVLERTPRLLARVTGDLISDYFLKLHQGNGVSIKLDAEVAEFLIEHDKVTGVRLVDGSEISTDMLLIGIGVLPNQELADACGLVCDNGIVVDDNALTSDPNIYAIGDCSMRPLKGQNEKLRLESVPNAIDQAEIVACHIAGMQQPAFDPPWFWSDQYKTKIQTVGLFAGYTDAQVRGDIDSGKFAVFYFKDDEFIAVDAVNDPQSFMASKQILKLGLPLSKATVQDTERTMMEILKALKE